MPNLLRLLIVPALALWLTACGDGDQQTLTITGSSTMAPFMADIAAAFEQRHAGYRLDVQSGGSSRGIRDVRQGIADLGMVSRSLRDEESDLQAYLVARDGLTMLVHAVNPLRQLTRDEVVALYRGQYDNWNELVDYDESVTIVNKSSGRATLAVFLEHFDLNNSEIDADMVIGENQQAIRSVAGNRGAIAYISIGTAHHEIEQGVSIHTVALNGREPDEQAVADGSYPLVRNLHLVSDGPLTETGRRFLEFVRSQDGMEHIRNHFFIPAGTEP